MTLPNRLPDAEALGLENAELRARLEEAEETLAAIRRGDVDALVVKEASVGKSITMKRFATRGRGKSTRILKPFSRVRIVVSEVEEA